jgi:hypothetical protein
MRNPILTFLAFFAGVHFLSAQAPSCVTPAQGIQIVEVAAPSSGISCGTNLFTFDLTNTSGINYSNAVIELQLPCGFIAQSVGPSNTVTPITFGVAPQFGSFTWNASSTETVSFYAIAPADLGSCPPDIQFNITSSSFAGTESCIINSAASLLQPSLEASLVAPAVQPYLVGQTGTHDFKISNIGSVGVDFLSIDLTPDQTTDFVDYTICNGLTCIGPFPIPITNHIDITSANLVTLVGGLFDPTDEIHLLINYKVTQCEAVDLQGQYKFYYGQAGPTSCPVLFETLHTDIDIQTAILSDVHFDLDLLPPVSPATWVNGSYCAAGSKTVMDVRITNLTPAVPGYPGSGRASNIKLYLSEPELAMGTYDLNAVMINGILVPYAIITPVSSGPYNYWEIDLNDWTAASAGSLENLDLDVNMAANDIAEGNSFTLHLEFIFNGNIPADFDECAYLKTEMIGRINVIAGNQCEEYDMGVGYANLYDNLYYHSNFITLEHFSNELGSALNTVTDVLEGDPFPVQICPRVRDGFYDYHSALPGMYPALHYDCPNGYYRVIMPLPPGYNLATPHQPISIDGDDNNVITPPVTFNVFADQVGTNLIIEFRAPGQPLTTFNTGSGWEIYHLDCFDDIMLVKTCTDPGILFDFTSLNYTVEFVCDDAPACTNVNTLGCGSTSTFYHCNGECTNAVFHTDELSFHMTRSTLGKEALPPPAYYDCSNYAAAPSVPPSANIELGRGYPGDEVHVTLTGFFDGTASSLTNMMMRIRYDQVPGTTAPDVFEFISGTISLNGTPYPVTFSWALSPTAPYPVLMDFNLAPADFTGIITPPNCIMVADITLRIKCNSNYFPSGIHDLLNLRAEFMGMDASTEYHSCDDWGTHFEILQPIFSLYETPQGLNGCGPLSMVYTLNYYGAYYLYGGEDFPNEFHPYMGLESALNVTIPDGYDFDYADMNVLEPDYSSSGINSFAGSTFTYMPAIPLTVSPVAVSGGTYIPLTGNANGCWPLLDLAATPSWGLIINIHIKPHCDAPDEPTYTSHDYQLSTSIQSTGPGCIQTTNYNFPSTTTAGRTYLEHHQPVLDLNMPTTQQVYDNTVSFTFQYCNSSSVLADNTWLLLNNPSGYLDFTSATVTSTFGPPFTATLVNFPGGDVLVQLGNLPQNCYTITLNANVVAGCAGDILNDEINVQGGYGCDGFPTSPAELDCIAATDMLTYSHYNSNVELTAFNPFSTTAVTLCGGTIDYDLLITNPGTGWLDDPEFSIQLPAGVSIIGVPEISYPWNTAPVPVTFSATVGPAVANVVIESVPLMTSDGLLGVSATLPDQNKALIHFTLQIDCGYNPNDEIYFTASGINSCSEPVSDTEDHLPNITESPVADDLSVSMDFTDTPGNNNVFCQSRPFRITVTNNALTTTNHSNTLTVTIPSTSYVVTTPVPAPDNVLGSVYTWIIPPGTPSGDYDIDFLIGTATGFCGTDQISLQMEYAETITCVEEECPISFAYANLNYPIVACCNCSVELGPDVTICAGDLVTLNGTVTGTPVYSWAPATGLSCTNCPNPDANPASTTTYTLTVDYLDGNICFDEITVNVNPLPNVTVNSPTMCATGSTNLQALGALTYVWNPGGSTANPLFITPPPTSYTVTGTDANGCSNTAVSTITTVAPPTITVTASPGFTICAGQSVTLTASGGINYYWVHNTITIGTTATITVSPTVTATFAVVGTSSLEDCNGYDTITVTVIPLPVVTATAVEDTICAGETSTLTASGATNYLWMPGSLPGSPVVVAPLTTTTYTVTGETSGCYSAPVSVTVTVLPGSGVMGWPKHPATPSSSNDDATDLVKDAAGNTYVIGNFRGTLNIEGSSFASPSANSFYVVKYTPDCGMEWIHWYSANSSANPKAFGRAIALDINGNVVITGGFSGNMSLAPVDPFCPTSLSNSYPSNAFVMRLNAATGNTMNAVQSTGTTVSNRTSEGTGITCRGTDVYVSGYFMYSVGFGLTTVSNGTADRDIFVAKLNSVFNPYWIKSFGYVSTVSSQYEGMETEVGVDNNGFVYVAATIYNQVAFGSTYGSATPLLKGFVACYTTMGAIYTGFIMQSATHNVIANDLKCFATGGGCLVTGSYQGTLNVTGFGNISGSASTAFRGCFMIKVNGPSPALSLGWMTRGVTTGGDAEGYSISADAGANGFVSGKIATGNSSFKLIHPLNSFPTLFIGTSATEGFACKLNSAGRPIYAISSTTTMGYNEARAIHANSDGSEVTVGGFFFTAAGGTTETNATITNTSGLPFPTEFYVTRVDMSGAFFRTVETEDSLTADLGMEKNMLVFPNPNNGSFTIQLAELLNPAQVHIYDSQGKDIAFEIGAINENQVELQLIDVAPGIYLVTVLGESQLYSERIVITK